MGFNHYGLWPKAWGKPFCPEAHHVALESDEVNPHGDGVVGVATESFDPIHQVGTELVASFQHTQHHYVMVSQVIHDISSETFCPVNNIKQ